MIQIHETIMGDISIADLIDDPSNIGDASSTSNVNGVDDVVGGADNSPNNADTDITLGDLIFKCPVVETMEKLGTEYVGEFEPGENLAPTLKITGGGESEVVERICDEGRFYKTVLAMDLARLKLRNDPSEYPIYAKGLPATTRGKVLMFVIDSTPCMHHMMEISIFTTRLAGAIQQLMAHLARNDKPINITIGPLPTTTAPSSYQTYAQPDILARYVESLRAFLNKSDFSSIVGFKSNIPPFTPPPEGLTDGDIPAAEPTLESIEEAINARIDVADYVSKVEKWQVDVVRNLHTAYVDLRRIFLAIEQMCMPYFKRD